MVTNILATFASARSGDEGALAPTVAVRFSALHVSRVERGDASSRKLRGVASRMAQLLMTVAVPLMTGCGVISRGMIYTDTVQPLCVDARGTTLGTRSASGSSKRVEIPTTRIDVSAEWDTRAIGDIAKANGISTVYGCDSRRQSVLLGLWRKDEVIIYGE